MGNSGEFFGKKLSDIKIQCLNTYRAIKKILIKFSKIVGVQKIA